MPNDPADSRSCALRPSPKFGSPRPNLYSLPAGTPCPFCRGRGWSATDLEIDGRGECRHCEGTGKVLPVEGEPPRTGALSVVPIQIFAQRELHAAYDYAQQGGQALHLMDGRFAYLRSDTPSCFKGRARIAHLFDQDKARLIATVQRLGVRVIRVEHENSPKQHIDLCGRPLEQALQSAARAKAGPAQAAPACVAVPATSQLSLR